MLTVHPINMLHVQDNWNWVLRDEAAGLTALVDPSQAEGISAFLEEKGWGLDYILNTHHHWDHTGGNIKLKKQYGCKVVGAARDAARIPLIDVALEENEPFAFGHYRLDTFDISGHTIGHIAFYCASAIPSSACGGGPGWGPNSDGVTAPLLTSPRRQGEESLPTLFVGDTLFAMGCGRMFEGTAEMYFASLQKIAALPDATQIFCAHEYTIANGRFARAMEPDNSAIDEHIAYAKERRRQKLPSLPTTVLREKQTNPFLRTQSATIRKNLAMTTDASDSDVFAALRSAKDAF